MAVGQAELLARARSSASVKACSVPAMHSARTTDASLPDRVTMPLQQILDADLLVGRQEHGRAGLRAMPFLPGLGPDGAHLVRAAACPCRSARRRHRSSSSSPSTPAACARRHSSRRARRPTTGRSGRRPWPAYRTAALPRARRWRGERKRRWRSRMVRRHEVG